MTQKEALDILKLGYNVYLTGTAGSGKSFVLRQYIDYIRNKGITVGITASTGVAATYINGTTIHSWAGVGIRETLSDDDMFELIRRRHLRRRFFPARILIIDEISMLSEHTFRLADAVCRAFKNNPAPFGGMQVILCGDFFQLPPVYVNLRQRPDPIYRLRLWSDLQLKICYLEREFRQDDVFYLSILRKIRSNTVDRLTINALAARLYKTIPYDIAPTRLYTHNADVHVINLRELGKLSGKEHLYPMKAKGHDYLVQTMRRNSFVPETLYLKKGALVMFIKNNFEKGYVNGTLGVVKGFSRNNYPVIETVSKREIIASPQEWVIDEGGEFKAIIRQVPLRLAWATTIHKSQGMTIDAAEIDLGKPFAKGMGYVALSRVKNLPGLRLLGLNHKALEIDRDVSEFDRKLQQSSRLAVLDLRSIDWLEKQVRQMEVLRGMKRKDGTISKPYDHYRQLQIPI